jgi:hypothetical protein
VHEGVLERQSYSVRPDRYAYRPTEKGRALGGLIATLMQWGDAYYPEPAGPPRLLVHEGCGGQVRQEAVCATCGERPSAGHVLPVPGPGAPPA